MLHPHGLGSFRLELCPPSTIAPLLNYSSPNRRREPLITRCGSLNDRAPARVRNEAMGPPPSGKSQGVDPNPSFQTEPERATAPYDLAARRVTEQNLRTISHRKPRGTTAHSSRCCSCVR